MNEVTQAGIRHVYPEWVTREGIDGRCYGRRATPGAALTVGPAEDWFDLMDQIRRAELMLEEARPVAWRS